MCKLWTSTQIMQEKNVVFLKNLHSWHKSYTTAGRDGRDKSQFCIYDTKSHCLLKREALKAKNRLFETHSQEVKCFPKELSRIYSIFIRIVLSLALSRKIDKTSGCCFGATFVLTLTQVIIVIIAQVINNRLITIALTFAISLVEAA